MINSANIPPITAKTTMENAKRWLNIIRYGESGTVIQLQDDCEYRVLEIINNRQILKMSLGENYSKYLIAYIPVDQKDLRSCIKDTLVQLCLKAKISNETKLGNRTNSDLLDLLSKKGFHVGLFISHISNVLKSNDYQPLFDLEYLIRTNENISVIVFSEIDITADTYDPIVDKASFLFDHIIKYPLYSHDDVKQFICYFGSLWNFTPSPVLISRIFHFCGGYLWLIHQTLRNLRDNPKLSIEEAASDELVLRKLHVIWSKCTENEKNILRKIACGLLEEPDTLTHEYEYLKRIRVVSERNNTAVLGIPILNHIIQKEYKLNQFQIRNDRIFKGDKDISGKLTKKEKILMYLFLSSGKKIISRNEIAQALWGVKWEDKYSDWAIDRLVFRYRQKLHILGIDTQMIKTVKKKGFVFG
jgi:DNA-binding winged helix-turn-helix (wHTH) protein